MEQQGSGQELTQAEVTAWTAGWDAMQERIGPRFARSEQRQRVHRFVAGLLSPVERKNGWQLAEQAGEARPYGMQRLVAGAKWDADAVRDDLRAYVVERLGDPRAMLVIDETSFLKQGAKSVGVKRQYSGTAGRIENCQIGVCLTYAAPEGQVLLDRERYLPREWADDLERRHTAGVPEEVRFATKPELARRMLERALAAGVPATWVTGDSIYGGDRRLRVWLEQREQPFVLAVTSAEPLWAVLGGRWGQPRADVIAAQIPAEAWQRLSAGAGAKGPRRYEWARVPLARLQLSAEERRWEHWLLVRRSRSDPTELAYSVVFAPTGTTLRTLARVAGQRWRIELIQRLQFDEHDACLFLEASLTVLAPHWAVPYARNPYFTGREALLGTLHARLANAGSGISAHACARTVLNPIKQLLRQCGRLLGKEGAMRTLLELPVPAAEELAALEHLYPRDAQRALAQQ